MAEMTLKMPTTEADALLGMIGLPLTQPSGDPSLSPATPPGAMPKPSSAALPPVSPMAAPDVPNSPLPAIQPTAAMGAPAGPPGSLDYAQRKYSADVARPEPGLLGKIGGYATSILAPGIARMIPQTPLGRIAQQGQDLATMQNLQEQEQSAKEAQSREDLASAQAQEARTRTEVDGRVPEEKNETAKEIAAEKNETAKEIASGKNKTVEDSAAERVKAQQDIAQQRIASQERIAQGRNLVSSEIARMRAASQDDPNKLTTMMKTQKQQAQATLPAIDKALDETEKIAGQLGPTQGRWNEFWQGQVGASDPAYAHYKDEIGMISTAVTLAHARGRMSNELFEHFQNMFDAGKQSPENMIQALNVAKEWLGTYANMGESGSPVSGGSAPPPGAKVIPLAEFLKGK